MIISDTQLNEILLLLIQDTKFYYPFAYSYFEDLYITGCRSTEPLDISRWKENNNHILLNTKKTEAVRHFDAKDISTSLLFAIYENIPPYDGLTYHQLTAEFRKHIRIHPIYSGDRIADTYLFRYNRARQLYRKTNSVAAVQDYFGWNSLNMAESYIMTPLIHKLPYH